MTFRHKFLLSGAIAATIALAAAGIAQPAGERPAIPASRQGKAMPGKENSPNGGRPEIHNTAEMRAQSGYTAPGAIAYADLAAEAGGALWPVTLAYRCKNTPGGTAITAPRPAPMEVFDGVYSIGDDANNIWAIKTSQGIILLDALSSGADAQNYIVANMRTLGLDPKDIRMILVSHNHFDHYGGVDVLRRLSGAKVGMSRADWDVPAQRGEWPAKGADDFYLTDGQKVTLGDFTLTVVVTPGHTPGTVSYVFPVTEKGKRHIAALFGGQGSPRDIDALMQFRASLTHFADYTDAMQADVILSNHTVGDDGLTKIAQLAKRRLGEPNPYVVGREGVVRYDAEWRSCLSANIDQRLAEGGKATLAPR